MPILQRTSGRLLRVVGGRPHATAEDHEDQLPTPPASHSTLDSLSGRKQPPEQEDDGDIYADPVDSSEDETQPQPMSARTGGFRASPTRDTATDSHTGSLHAQFSKPPAPSPGSGSSKRSFDAVEGNESDDGIVFSSQASQGSKMPRLGEGYTNIHAPPKAKGRNPGYGKKYRPQSQDQEGSGRKGFKKPPVLAKVSGPKTNKFRAPPSKPGKENDEPTTSFRQPPAFCEQRAKADAQGFHDLSDSDSDSSLSLPPPSPEIEVVELDPAPPYIATETCAICADQVPTTLREDFEDAYTGGKKLNFKRQQMFCTHHKQATAKEVWKQRNYPDIDWNGLELRLKNHHDFLRKLLSGEAPSALREEYAANQKGRKKTVRGLQKDSSHKPKGTSAGYYGPRGEHAITQHLLGAFNEELRAQSSRDVSMASSGVAGGVSGYVQAVLVPELAVRLVEEDLGVDGERARGVLDESAEVGMLLNSEVVGKKGRRSSSSVEVS